MNIKMLYGTETGNSEMLCDDFEDALGSGFNCEIADLGDTEPTSLSPDDFHIFVTSTFGTGDLPTNALTFYDSLNETKTDLSGIRFAIFGLGDMVFDQTFNQGSQKLCQLLLECNAQMVGERGLHDASSGEMPEDVALPWLQTILPLLSAEAA